MQTDSPAARKRDKKDKKKKKSRKYEEEEEGDDEQEVVAHQLKAEGETSSPLTAVNNQVPVQFLTSVTSGGLPTWLANPISISPHIEQSKEYDVTHPQWRLSERMQQRLIAAGISVKKNCTII